MATQSGAFGSAAYGMATLRGIGLSRVIATGNEADVDVAECIDYLADDADTRVICAALEACKDGARLRAALRKAAAAGKPVVIMKIGRTEVGAAAADAHRLAGGQRRDLRRRVRRVGARTARHRSRRCSTSRTCAPSPASCRPTSASAS